MLLEKRKAEAEAERKRIAAEQEEARQQAIHSLFTIEDGRSVGLYMESLPWAVTQRVIGGEWGRGEPGLTHDLSELHLIKVCLAGPDLTWLGGSAWLDPRPRAPCGTCLARILHPGLLPLLPRTPPSYPIVWNAGIPSCSGFAHRVINTAP